MPRLKFACLVIQEKVILTSKLSWNWLKLLCVDVKGITKRAFQNLSDTTKIAFCVPIMSFFFMVMWEDMLEWFRKDIFFWVLWLNSVFSLAQSIQLDTMKLHRILWGGVRFHLLLCYYIALWGITEVMTFDIVFSSSSLLHATLHVIINFHCFANFPFHLIETYHHKRLGLFREKKRPHKKSQMSKFFWTLESLKDKVHLKSFQTNSVLYWEVQVS